MYTPGNAREPIVLGEYLLRGVINILVVRSREYPHTYHSHMPDKEHSKDAHLAPKGVLSPPADTPAEDFCNKHSAMVLIILFENGHKPLNGKMVYTRVGLMTDN